ncbi:acetyl/propionyl/methylcrotonyl-CoA carboxylase subunit alpha [Agromyces atrinae]|uniref:biotin carboxylase n=1 Tax=Agromyces atrinae TaxID=592376 RepID=A0A4Q2M2L7_9MICO|nr:biotin carboxylase N-terminal domain-containing protein [Agromyces atrinae]NYD65833.1 acetyl-CoA/propionyl-CoA carboxylase biotin carboxyl carrier protein [Agromyces atrinae]RXZ86184.1 ATP-grasp domain-containing protein [Agromyces atrinae]
MPLFDSVLVANRGEIAVRIIRTLRRLGIRSIAVYSDADIDSPHVSLADVAVRIGPADARESYLDPARIVRAATQTGASAVHPGYGFLSESIELLRACDAAGIVLIGPGALALDVMGDKIRAKAHVAGSGVRVVPGIEGGSDDDLLARVHEVGFPLLVKPAAGGGGKGMQIVRDTAGLPEALRAARRIASAAFGDDSLLLERLIDRPRHIEVQVLADAVGTTVALGERECTLQRRHQKVIEEAPSPALDDDTRARLGAAAVEVARSVDYRGAGTVEFLVSADAPDDFFFIEMNTRLQVEHPVTELVTGVDLVEQQVRIAAGEALAIGSPTVTGHAIEARVYAEDPDDDFLPSAGEILLWHEPEGAGIRVDSGIATGGVVSTSYDPMLAKIIAHGSTRAEAIERLDVALAETVLAGVTTNVGFLRELLADPDVREGRLDTGLIGRRLERREVAAVPASVVDAAATWLEAERTTAGAVSPEHRRPASALWSSRSGWRVGEHRPVHHDFVDAAGRVVSGRVLSDRTASDRTAESGTSVIAVRSPDGAIWVHAEGTTARLEPLTREARLARELAARAPEDVLADPALRSSMPGTVVALLVADGARVETGDTVLAIEAMKMEHPVRASISGVIRLRVAVGDRVDRAQIVAEIEPSPTPPTPDSPTTDTGS